MKIHPVRTEFLVVRTIETERRMDGQTYGRTYGQTDMTKRITTFRNFANLPKNKSNENFMKRSELICKML
jgi:hypothetical protein